MMLRKKILIVDPSPVFRRDLKATLETHETLVDVYTAGHADHAKDIMRKQPPDVIFIEVDLPLDVALELIQSIRRQAPESHIVAMAGAGSEAVKIAALEHGANDYLVKEVPVGFGLIDFIHAVVRRR